VAVNLQPIDHRGIDQRLDRKVNPSSMTSKTCKKELQIYLAEAWDADMHLGNLHIH
jgi:hypothetical protein